MSALQPSTAAPSTPAEDESDLLHERQYVPLPASSVGAAHFKPTSTLTPVICDERAISRLLELLLSRGGLTTNEAASRLGINAASLRQYVNGRRGKPSLLWFLKFAALCGARVTIEFPEGSR